MSTIASGAGELLERRRHLETLQQALAAVRARAGGRLVLVRGEAGIGKTALLEAFARTRPRGTDLLWAACDPLFAPRPLGPLLDVSPALGGELQALIEHGARPHDVAAALGRELAARGPAVLVLEDLHWADEATLDVVRLLGRRAAGLPVLVVVSFRDEHVHRTHPLAIVLGELPAGVSRLALEPLSRDAVETLAAASPLDAAELYERTGGNPFFVTEVLAAHAERVPATVRDAVIARAARLGPPARALLDAVAIVPQTAELWLVEALAGSLGALDECLAAGILAGDAQGVAFRHELARLAIEGSLPPHRAVALHRAAASALAAHAGDPARLAHHAEAAADPDGVLRWAPEAAARAAASGAHREAAAQYARALRYADRLPLDRHAELLQRRADECDVTAEYDEAIAAQRRALECRRRLGDPRGAADALRSLSRMLFFNGDGAEAQPLVLEAVELLERLPPGRELALAYGNVCQREMVLEHHAAALDWGGRALELAERLGDAEATAYALVNVGATLGQAERDDAEPTLRRALALALSHELDEQAARAYLHLTHAALRRGRLDAAGEHLEAGLRFCGERGLDAWRLYLLALRARRELALARWDDAAASATAVLEDPRPAPVPRGWALTALGLVRARRGEPGAAEALDEAYALVRETGEPMRVAPVAAARAEAAWLGGEDERVGEVTAAALALTLERGARSPAAELAGWRRRAGLYDDPGLEDVAGPYALWLAGDAAAAARGWRELGHRYEAALALADTGEAGALRRALDELLALDARPAAALVSRRLRVLGARDIPRGPRRRTRENPAGLTPREVEVLRLMTEGLRNAEIAARLIVSTKTVDHHVSRILRKLDVPTRAAAGAAAARLGLT